MIIRGFLKKQKSRAVILALSAIVITYAGGTWVSSENVLTETKNIIFGTEPKKETKTSGNEKTAENKYGITNSKAKIKEKDNAAETIEDHKESYGSKIPNTDTVKRKASDVAEKVKESKPVTKAKDYAKKTGEYMNKLKEIGSPYIEDTFPEMQDGIDEVLTDGKETAKKLNKAADKKLNQ